MIDIFKAYLILDEVCKKFMLETGEHLIFFQNGKISILSVLTGSRVRIAGVMLKLNSVEKTALLDVDLIQGIDVNLAQLYYDNFIKFQKILAWLEADDAESVFLWDKDANLEALEMWAEDHGIDKRKLLRKFTSLPGAIRPLVPDSGPSVPEIPGTDLNPLT